MSTQQTTVTMKGTMSASPERVFRAWLEPELLRRWLAPGSLEVTRAEVDERVGGRYRIWQRDAAGEDGGFECEIIELVPHERLVFDWGWVGPERTDGPVYDSRLTVTLQPTSAGGTDLTLVHERLEALFTALPFVAENFEAGWHDVLGKLDASLAAGG